MHAVLIKRLFTRLRHYLDKVFIINGSVAISRRQLLNISYFLAQNADVLGASKTSDQNDFIYIDEEDPLANLCLMLAVMFADKVPVFGLKRTTDVEDENVYVSLEDFGITDINVLAATTSDLYDLQTVMQIFNDLDKPVVGLHTITPAGNSIFAEKNWISLLSETCITIDISGASEKDRFLSLVMPSTTYGFLYSFLIPFFSGAEVRYILKLDQEDPLYTSLGNPTVLVSTPLQWKSRVKSILQEYPLKLILMSSDHPLGIEKERDFLTLITQLNLSTKLIEILGNTQTGTLAYREVSSGFSNRKFKILPGVELTHTSGKISVSSPFLYPRESTSFIANNLRLSEDGLLEYNLT